MMYGEFIGVIYFVLQAPEIGKPTVKLPKIGELLNFIRF